MIRYITDFKLTTSEKRQLYKKVSQILKLSKLLLLEITLKSLKFGFIYIHIHNKLVYNKNFLCSIIFIMCVGLLCGVPMMYF